MDFFYDGQVRRYLTQFMRIMSNFSYKDAKGQLVRVPVRYGDMNRQVGQILKKNSENTIPSAPFIACYIKDLQFDRARMQDPTFVSKISIRERSYDEQGQEYLNTQGSNYTVERVMPTPYLATFAIDIWTTNTEQKLQLFEQIAVLFTPSLELQTTDNYIDWTSISVLTLTGQTWSSRSIPQGVEQDIDILSMTFESHVWITAPAKVKQLGIITKIITSAFTAAEGVISGADGNFDAILDSITADNIKTILTPGNFDLLVLNNVANLVPITSQGSAIVLEAPGTITSWRRLLDLYPGEFRAGLSQLRLMKDDGNEIVAFISLDPNDETKMVMNIDPDTIPSNTIISGRGTVDAIINPETFNPGTPATGTRYLILENINVNAQYSQPDYDGPDAWKNADDGSDTLAYANDIIEWNGSRWNTVFNSADSTNVTYITNSYTGIQYKWSDQTWSKSFEGIYDKGLWRLIL